MIRTSSSVSLRINGLAARIDQIQNEINLLVEEQSAFRQLHQLEELANAWSDLSSAQEHLFAYLNDEGEDDDEGHADGHADGHGT